VIAELKNAWGIGKVPSQSLQCQSRFCDAHQAAPRTTFLMRRYVIAKCPRELHPLARRALAGGTRRAHLTRRVAFVRIRSAAGPSIAAAPDALAQSPSSGGRAASFIGRVGKGIVSETRFTNREAVVDRFATVRSRHHRSISRRTRNPGLGQRERFLEIDLLFRSSPIGATPAHIRELL
jgi:hypothetical protein